jgi:hypothetical protein
MRKLLSLFGLVLLVTVLAGAQAMRQNLPIYEKMRQMDAQSDINLPVPVLRPKIQPAQLREEAAEIARLAQSIAPQVQQATQGVMSKDLGQNLKEIEKMAKHLRRDLNL